MAILHASIFSQTLKRTVPIEVILPADKVLSYGQKREAKQFKTLYLLHGLLGSCEDWTQNDQYPAAGGGAGPRGGDAVGGRTVFMSTSCCRTTTSAPMSDRKLVELTRRMFPLSDRREDTFLGGLSMGGFGALRNGLKYCETFGSIVSSRLRCTCLNWSRRIPDGRC